MRPRLPATVRAAACSPRGPVVPGVIQGSPIAVAGRGPTLAGDPASRRKLLALGSGGIALGLAVLTWTENEVDRIVELARMGCDGIISDWPERLLEARDVLG